MEMGSCSSREIFALQVKGDSMAPEFNDGNVIIVDPEGHVQDQSYVIAKVNGAAIFRQLRIENGRYLLKALAEDHEVHEISGLDAIEGVITQQAGRRRKDRKYYRPQGLS